MKKTGNFICILFLVLLSAINAAAEVTVQARVDRNQLSIGEAFTLSLRVQADEDFELEEPTLPSIPGLELINSAVGGRQSSSSMSIINGKTQFVSKTSQDYNYLLSPQKEGTFLIPVLDITIKGQTYKTDPIKIEVKEEFRNSRGKAQPRGRPQFPPGFGDDDDSGGSLGSGQSAEDLFEKLLQDQMRGRGFGQRPDQLPDNAIPAKKLNVNTEDAFFVYLDLDKDEVYEGEQVTANWYIYTRANIDSLDRVKFPDLKGFWKEIIEEVPSLQFTEEIVNGVRYRKALLASHALFPIKAGVAVIDEFKIKAKVRMPNQFGWGQPREWTRASRRAEIKVLPLPQEGRTQSFSGAVGSYRMSLKTEGNSFPANQPFSIKMRYEGLGNAKLIDLPTINWPAGLEVYDTKSEAKFFKEGNSYKEFEVLVIPRKEGEFKIPALQLTYFDPLQKKYISEATQELVLQITPGNPAAVTSATGSGANPSVVSAEEQFKPQAILQFPEAGLSFASYRIYFYLIGFVGGLLILFSYAMLQLKNLKFEPEILVIINNKLQLIDKYSTGRDYRKIGSEATNLIYLLVANLAGQKKADQEIHLLVNEISSKDQHTYLDRINKLFDYFQLLGFSPEEVMQAELNKKPVAAQIEQLKKLSKEVVEKLRKENKNNT